MTIQEAIKSGATFEDIRKLFKRPVFEVEQADAIKQYKVKDHKVLDPTVRKPKSIIKGTGEIGADGKEKTTTAFVEPVRIGMNFQKLIVDRRVGFMLTIPVKTETVFDAESDKEKQLISMVDRIQHDNKMDYVNKEIARKLMSEMEVAELWYLVENENISLWQKLFKTKGRFTLKVKILSPDNGDTLYPVFDSYGSLTAFGREYKIKEGEKDIEHFDIYLPELEYYYAKRDGTWNLDERKGADGKAIPNPRPNLIGKIMVVYHSQPAPEWADQQSMIERLENCHSNHGDMNDYFGSPILTILGEIQGWVEKGDAGKVLQLEENAKASFLALNSPPESIDMEQKNLKGNIFMLSQTPDISFETMKGMGTIAQFTMKAFFMDAHMAVGKKEEIFGKGLQRRLNLIKSSIGKVIDVSLSKEAETVLLKPVITPYLPGNTTEVIENLSVAVTGGFLSKESAIEKNPLVVDSEIELDRIKADNTTELKENSKITEE